MFWNTEKVLVQLKNSRPDAVNQRSRLFPCVLETSLHKQTTMMNTDRTAKLFAYANKLRLTHFGKFDQLRVYGGFTGFM